MGSFVPKFASPVNIFQNRCSFPKSFDSRPSAGEHDAGIEGDIRMWEFVKVLIDGEATPCLALEGQLYPFPALGAALRAELPATTTALFADWPAAAATLQNQAILVAAGKGPAPLDAAATTLLAP